VSQPMEQVKIPLKIAEMEQTGTKPE
jgi:hypothetical protein